MCISSILLMSVPNPFLIYLAVSNMVIDFNFYGKLLKNFPTVRAKGWADAGQK
jgi:hypothetical protein